MNKDEHPLIVAIMARKRAIRLKADPKMIKMLDKRISAEAAKSIEILGDMEWMTK